MGFEAGKKDIEEPFARGFLRHGRIDGGKHALIDLPDVVGEHRHSPVVMRADFRQRDACPRSKGRKRHILEGTIFGQRQQRFDDGVARLGFRHNSSSFADLTAARGRGQGARRVLS
jgi:hypothetical protein